MFCLPKKKKIYPAYVSKRNSNHEKQVIFLMIPNGEGHDRSTTLESDNLSYVSYAS